ncbi:MAG: 2Fe-2S iron-sulfur cluster-binding protein [Planctomycetota bacterium]
MISPNMVSLTIDGKNVEVEEGATILDAARKVGIEIPTLCHHPALKPSGACRLCLVEIVFSWGSRLQTSCVYPAQEGLEVRTNTERVRRTRKVIMELLLARCPEVESIRRMAKEMGVEETRFPKKNEDCILCGLCARVCEERMGVGAINFANRGTKKKIAPAYDRQSPVCMACGACTVVCPTECIDLSTVSPRPARPIASEFDEGLMGRPSIFMPFAQAVPHKPVIDKNTCVRLQTGDCGACEAVCDANAIMFDQEDTIEEIGVGTIIVATGFELFDASRIARYGYGRLKNVINALEFERMSHASGPTSGEVLTAEGKAPRSVAIIHCVGSRDENYQEYCSRVCCMYSLKFAHLVLEKTGAEVYNFYIDMRTPGKGYEEFYKRLLHEGVNFVRGKCAEVTEVAESPEEEGKLIVVGEDTLLGVTRRVPVDMVILSAGLKPHADVAEVAHKFSLSCAQGEFFLEKHPKLAPVEAASDGIYLAGACQGPKDIPDTVAQGAAAAACALALMDKGSITLEPITSWIDPDRCSGCQTCLASCPYGAIEFDEEKKVSVVVEELCKGCGTCVATCPAGVAQQKSFADAQIYAELDGILS